MGSANEVEVCLSYYKLNLLLRISGLFRE
jgi:hypothetical protein